ncbi:hypothetical protein [uncultured Treponema sp.]|uniref:hypothetical protein n=1 Tax=uncultured Treponema sp. TaxID=162155 RepID=UPI0025D3846D|nr:hypothetical protein [uncultured Treponema sp.]
MNNTFNDAELLYRAVYPPEMSKMFWKDGNHVSSAAFLDKNGLSVERGNFRTDNDVINEMKKFFIGKIVSVSVKLCRNINASVLYKPTKRSLFHSVIKLLFFPPLREDIWQ